MKQILSSLLAAGLLAGCAGLGGSTPEKADFDALWKAAGERPEVELGAAILAGELAIRRQMPQQAAQHFATAARLSDDAQVAARATQLALQADNAALSRQAVLRWIELAPEHDGAREIAARLALRDGEFDRAVEQLIVLLGRGEPDDKTVLRVANVLAAEPLELDQALSLYAVVMQDLPPTAAVAYGRALLAYRLGGNEQAQASLAQALMLRPDWRQAQMLALRLHLQAGEDEQARHVIRDLHVVAPRDLDLRLALGGLLLEYERLDMAAREFSKALKIDPDNVSALYALGLIALDADQLDQARKRFLRLRALGQRSSDAAFYLGRIAERDRQPAQALQYYREVSEGLRVLDAAIRQAVIISQEGQLPAAREYLAGLRLRYPQHELRLFQVEGELLYQAGEDQAAERVYSKALEQYVDDTDLLYGRAVVRERLGRFAQAEADLRQIIRADAQDARALNALGYMLSNHTQRLDEAATYIRQALSLTPDDPAVIDSMGWVLFRQGQLEQARGWLERAYAQMPDPEVAAHLGEVLWLQGEQQRARAVWGQALQEHPEHPVLRETVERLDSSL